MGLMLAEPGFHARAFVEWEEYPISILIAAQRAGYFAPAPIWDDVTTFDGRPFRGALDTILAGYPCQPFSQAGQRKGADDERHLWPDVARIIREIGPTWVFLENVAGHVTLGLETVLRDLWDMGWTPAAGLFSAAETGAPHERLRIFIVAHRQSADGERDGRQPAGWQRSASGGRELADADGRNASPEWQQCSGQQRFHPENGRAEQTALDDAGRAERRAVIGAGCICHGDDDGRSEAASRSGKSGETLDHPAGPRCDGEGIGPEADIEGGQCLSGDRCAGVGHAARLGRGEGRAEPEFRGGRDTASSAGGTMADTCGARLEGRERGGSPDERHGAPASGSTAERGSPFLFPPGPGDGAAWSAVLTMAPGLAPSVAFGDIARRAHEHFAMAEKGELAQAAAESELRRMVDGLASRSRALRLLGNGVHPLAAGHAWRALAAAHGLWPVDLAAADQGDITRADETIVRAAE